ncbi:hypothetical protein GQ457_06G025000 [Hibiscus cannabinus]
MMMRRSTKTPLKKTNSLLLKNQSHFSMEHPHHLPRQQSGVFLNRKASRGSPHAAELFPSSPEVPPIGDGIFHVTHPEHPITQIRLPDLFTCGACKEYGAGERFTCTDFQMHPCCAMLSTQINISVHPHTLRLLPGLSPSSDPTGIVCGECNRRRSGKVYQCTTCDYHLHAVCAKNMVNGLEANGIKGMDRPSKVATAAKLASQVVIEFIGGLIEGIGESVGQVLIQTATRGRCCNNRSTRTE